MSKCHRTSQNIKTQLLKTWIMKCCFQFNSSLKNYENWVSWNLFFGFCFFSAVLFFVFLSGQWSTILVHNRLHMSCDLLRQAGLGWKKGKNRRVSPLLLLQLLLYFLISTSQWPFLLLLLKKICCNSLLELFIMERQGFSRIFVFLVKIFFWLFISATLNFDTVTHLLGSLAL